MFVTPSTQCTSVFLDAEGAKQVLPIPLTRYGRGVALELLAMKGCLETGKSSDNVYVDVPRGMTKLFERRGMVSATCSAMDHEWRKPS